MPSAADALVTTMTNGAAWGTDYFTRVAVAKSNIFVNVAKETAAFTSDQILEQSGVAILAQAEQLPSLALKLLQ